MAAAIPPHPTLTFPILHVRGGISSAVDDAQIVQALSECLRVRPNIPRESGSRWESAKGTLEFEDLHRAEKALATVNRYRFPGEDEPLRLYAAPTCDNPVPKARSRIVKLLPETMTPGALFEACRPFGPIHSIVAVPTQASDGSISMIVTFLREEHALAATKELHLAEVGSHTVTVEIFDPASQTSPIPPAATMGAISGRRGAFPARGESHGFQSPVWHTTSAAKSPGVDHACSPSTQWSPTNSRVASWTAQTSKPHPGWSPQPRSFSGTQSRTQETDHLLSPTRHLEHGIPGVDPCNLFIKNLDQATTTEALHTLFQSFGTIVSARVMEEPVTKASKEFGFVSFTRAEDAAMALAAMNGYALPESNKKIIVRLHEPKTIREGRLRRLSDASRGSTQDLVNVARGLTLSVTSSASSSYSDCGRSPSPSRIAPEFSFSSADTSPDPPPTEVFPRAIAEAATPSKLSDPERLRVAVSRLLPANQVEDVVSLILELPKKEQKLCLFNTAILKDKVADACEVLAACGEEESVQDGPSRPQPSTPSGTPKPSMTVPGSLEALARLPVASIIPLLPYCNSLGIDVAAKAAQEETNTFMDGLEGKPVHEMKQKLGERVFKAIKATGVKGAPRYTIYLLDTEELRPLAHLLAYPSILREKVLSIGASPPK
ncbi:BZ3500_MvSof-1268-A1-R1_Chr3-1g05575 [Microbotryum saponariae]|uniref:BZ3500_MvSof-1268-A1-R1_Chr3-1g05575 protein n=1 Tax=Microbotryum saponariae TaxID=289078 RepID=A0A2X0KX71_9BASI|nr:BZ3500_MvSof-1268-A1-R1_Chr3-1g05575 [Microbotryum saponariae]SDA04765.1 BZ3501_MvSof-1269-A2-R1_Chr3-1g05245 [Microbotryum saponariae]